MITAMEQLTDHIQQKMVTQTAAQDKDYSKQLFNGVKAGKKD